jgi:hypothetical protein
VRGGRAWPIATAIFGFATLATLVGFSFLPEVRAAYPNGDFGPALSAFQRAVEPSELDALFGAPPDSAKLAAMTAGNTLDLYGFIPIYTLFLVCAAAMLAGGARKPLAWAAIAPALLAAAADIFETWTQLQMTSDWARAEELLPAVAPACWTKYFALGAHALGCTAIGFAGRPRRWILGALGFIPIAGVFADWAGALHIPSLMSMTFGVFWLALLGLALAQILAKRTD